MLPRDGLSVTERLCKQILSLPMYPELSDADVVQVISVIRGFFTSRRSVIGQEHIAARKS